MSDSIKHECAVALLRLLDGGAEASTGLFAEASDPGGTALSLLLEKQHNRGQDGAGAAILSLNPEPGAPAYWISKSASSTALADVLGAIGKRSESLCRKERKERKEVTVLANSASFAAENDERIFLGHLRYATYGKGDESFCHPFVHASPRLGQTLFLAGNFNLTNTHELFDAFRAAGNHAASSADGYLICELLAAELADCSQISNVHNCPQITKPNGGALGDRALPNETPRTLRTLREKELPREEPPILRALRAVLPKLDGAYTLCGMTGDGWAFAVRDAHGIRPGWYLSTPRAVAVASERPAIQAAFDVPPEAVRELPPGEALLVSPAGEVRFERVLPPAEPRPCAFERIYFSRANDADIHRERKALGAALAPVLLETIGGDLENTFFSYIPNSAQVAFHGLLEALWTEGLAEGRPVRFGQIAVKDAKFRTFIADAAARREIKRHVYDVTYGLVRPGTDTLVVLDDSIVRGTTMRDAILPMLDRLGPKRIVVASSAPPIRYPDCYGIDMSTLGELVAFRALVNLLGENARAELRAALARGEKSHAEFAESAEFVLRTESAENAADGFERARRALRTRATCASNAGNAGFELINPLAPLYARFTETEHCAEIARLLTPPGMRAEVSVVYQSVAALHAALVPSLQVSKFASSQVAKFESSQVAKFESSKDSSPLLEPANLQTCERANARGARPGDWYFTGDYPTPGGYRVLLRSLDNYLAHRMVRSY